MGIKAYIVEHKGAKLQGCNEFFDFITEHFRNDEGEIYIETQTWKDLMEDCLDIATRWPDEVKEVEQDLVENNGCLTYAFF